ncbi:MAG: response regulator [Planctomycetes bacterium]|nr:response regulator [Planctomycetota bacterium]
MSEASILLLEDSRIDAQLTELRLRQSGLRFRMEYATNRAEFEAAVVSGKFDLILADHTLPDYDGRAALELVQALRLDVPFIFVSGTLGEELAVDMLKLGATDYVLKQRLDRLVPAVREALKLIAERREKQRVEAELRLVESRYRQLVEDAPDGIFIADADGRLIEVNRAGCEMLGYSRERLLRMSVRDVVNDDDHARIDVVRAELEAGLHAGEWELLRADGSRLPVEVRVRTLDDGRTHAIVRDVRQRKEAENALREADRRKDEFLAMLAHELRNPLAPIRNALHVLQLQGNPDPALQTAADVMTRQVDHMVRLVDDLLDVSRITRGKITLRRETITLNEVVRRAVEAARPLIDSRRHALDVALPEHDVFVSGDVNRLTQVVMNLLINAAKFTPNDGHLRVGLTQSGGQAQIRVCDDGIGIAPDTLGSIFDLFVQADRTLDRSQGGLGIGLTLVRRIVEMHEGSVAVQSDGPQCGSEFVVNLPTISRPTRKPEHNSADGASASSRLAQQLRVLIVDDNHDSATTLAMLVRLWGCEVATAYDGAEALARLAEGPPHLVLLDLGLPNMDGFEVLRRIRDLDPERLVRVAALTGYGSEEDRRRTTEAGFHHHFVKPVNPAALHDVLREIARDVAQADGAQVDGAQVDGASHTDFRS